MRYLDQLPVVWQSLRTYFRRSRVSRRAPVVDRDGLADFINTRASHVAQTSLYGYLRTRAGSRYPELFADDYFMVSVNIAKWQVWVACVSDLAVFAGGLVKQRSDASDDAICDLITYAVHVIFAETGEQEEAGDGFAGSKDKLLARLRDTDWSSIEDGEQAFTESPDALVEWSPIINELKELDSEIVRNSVRYRWTEIRRDLRQVLDARAVLASHRSDDRD